MSAYDLPVALEVAGKEYGIRSDFRAVLDILIAMTDPDLSDYEKEDSYNRRQLPPIACC